MNESETDLILTDHGQKVGFSFRFDPEEGPEFNPKQSLLDRVLCRSPPSEEDLELARRGRTLDTFFGVIVPCCLSMFSGNWATRSINSDYQAYKPPKVVLFLRMGFIIGQAGLLWSLLMLVLGKFKLVFESTMKHFSLHNNRPYCVINKCNFDQWCG